MHHIFCNLRAEVIKVEQNIQNYTINRCLANNIIMMEENKLSKKTFRIYIQQRRLSCSPKVYPRKPCCDKQEFGTEVF